MIRLLVTLALLLFALPAIAQDDDAADAERSLFLGFVEDQLSGPNREIRIGNIQGVLSSNATIGEITIADREGVWLRIVNASIVWSRSALILRQRLEIENLSAERIDVLRRPLPAEGLPAPEAAPSFAVPDLPIAVNLANLEVPLARFGPTVFGLESELSLQGRLRLEAGDLDTALEIVRLDGPGGQLALSAVYTAATGVMDIDLDLTEPENGVVANLLNIEGRPPVELRVAGSGPISDVNVEIALDVAEQQVLAGGVLLRQQAEGLSFHAQLAGPIATIVPAQFRPFFGDETALVARGLLPDPGGLRLDTLQLASGALHLDVIAETAADWFLQRLRVDAVIDDDTEAPVVLPVPGGRTTVGRAVLALAFGEGPDDDWTGALAIEDLSTPGFAVENVNLTLSGLAENIDDPLARRLTYAVEGTAQGITAADPQIDEALGERIELSLEGEWNAGEPLAIDEAILSARALDLIVSGTIEEFAFEGEIGVRTASVAPFSDLLGRPLSGAAELRASGEIWPVSGAFALLLDGRIEELRVGIEAVDNLMGGETVIAGRLERTETGLRTDDFRIANPQFELTADGDFATGAADFTFDLALEDLALVSPQAAGRLTATGRALGSEGRIALTSTVQVPTGRLAGRRLTDGVLAFEGELVEGDLGGFLTGSVFLDGVRAEVATTIAVEGQTWTLSAIDLRAGGARATGELTRLPQGLFDGRLQIAAPDVSTAAALLLVRASGAVDAELVLSAVDGRQDAAATATVRNLVLDGTRVGEAALNAQIADLFGVPRVEGTARATSVSVAGIDIETLELDAELEDDTTRFTASADLAGNVTAAAAGRLAPENGGYRVSLDSARIGRGIVAAVLVEPASVLVVGDRLAIDALVLDVAGGRVSVRGQVAEAFDLSLDVTALPLAIGNLVRPDLALGGTIDGTARVTGPRAQPDVAFDLRGRGIAAAPLREAGISSVSVDAEGETVGGRIRLQAALVSPEGVRAGLTGSIPAGTEGPVALDVTLGAFPLTIVNALAPGQGLGGTLTGTGRVTGTLAAPQVAFDLAGAALSAAALREAGIAALDVRAAGSFADGVVTLSSASATGPLGLSFAASGTLPVTGAGANLSFSGSVPLALANRFLLDRGTQVAGTLQVEGTLGGSLAQPIISASVTTAGAQVLDPLSNVGLRNLSLAASLRDNLVTITSASATLAAGGTVTASGTIGIDAAAGFPANLSVALVQARYTDGDFLVATASGNLSVTGALARSPLISGSIAVERAEIGVPENLGGGAAMIDVIHRNPPRPVRETLERARAPDGTPVPLERPNVPQLDITISAPNRIFVRGRGLDAELGGSLRITGSASNVQPVGGFQLIRGRLQILGQRITFDEGTVTLVGDLDPYINLVARTTGQDITVFITVTGRVSDLDISFSSQPELPEDEVLARLIFNRGIGELSPLQLAQLAIAAADLAGGGDTGLLGSLRAATGLDDLDVITDAEGNVAVRAGRYIQENVYLGVEAGARGSARATINLDITEDIRARGAVGTDGESSLGIFFERDY